MAEAIDQTHTTGDMPAWAAKKLAKAEAEIATYQRKIAEINVQLKAVWSAEQLQAHIDSHLTGLADERLSLWRENAGRRAGLDVRHHKRLRGTTREELAADAIQLVEITSL